MEWVMVVWLTLYGEIARDHTELVPMPDKATCYEALGNVRHEIAVPDSSDRRRAIAGFVAYCRPA